MSSGKLFISEKLSGFMETICFLAGNEKKFLEFISDIRENDRVAIISHTDLDGVAAAKVVNEVVKAVFVKLIDYVQIDDGLVKELRELNATKVVITDMVVNEYEHIIKKITEFAEVLMIDHHPFARDFNSDRVTFLSAKGYCATYLAYYLFSKVKNIEKLDWLVACACVADWMYHENKVWMTEVYLKYEDKFEILGDNQIRKSGKIWDLQWALSLAIIYWKTNKGLIEVFNQIGEKYGEISNLASVAGEVEKEINDVVKKFEKEKKEINGRIVFEFKPHYNVGSIISTMTGSRIVDKTILICRERDKYFHFSTRRQDGGEDVNILLKKLTAGLEDAEGGGHTKAAGGHVLLKDKKIFFERLTKI